MQIEQVPVVVLAGSRLGEEDPVAQLGKVPHKALFPVRGKPMIERVVDTLSKTPRVGQIWVCIEDPDKVEHLAGRVRFVPVSPTLQETVAETLKVIGTPCLVTTADHALLQPKWVDEFLDKAEKSDADILAAVALKERVEADSPVTKRTYLPFSDKRFSGCNLFYFSTPKALKLVELWGSVQKFRKNPLKMAKALGGKILVKAIAGRVTTVMALARIQEITGAKLEFAEMSDGRMAIDIDKVSDVDTVNEVLKISPELI